MVFAAGIVSGAITRSHSAVRSSALGSSAWRAADHRERTNTAAMWVGSLGSVGVTAASYETPGPHVLADHTEHPGLDRRRHAAALTPAALFDRLVPRLILF